MGSVTAQLVERLTAVADPSRAPGEQAYLKSDRSFLGVGVPAGRRVVRDLARELDLTAHDRVVAVALEWWDGPWFECRRAAVELLAFRAGQLGADDLVLVESLVRDGETWAIVDPLSTEVAGAVVARWVDASVGATLDRWAADATSFWVRRSALLCLLPSLRDGGREWERFGRYADAMLEEREFFVRKAIGWVLRDVARRDPERVRAWVSPRLDRMSGVTRREALKYL